IQESEPLVVDAALLLEKGYTLSVTGCYQEAMDALHGGFDAARSTDEPLAGRILLQLARAETMSSTTSSAIAHTMEAQEIFRRCRDLEGMAIAMRVAGDAFLHEGNIDEA